MRNILIILILIVILSSKLNCKDISGYYCNPFCETGFSIEFKESSKFNYSYHQGIISLRGYGKYNINDSILTLNFENYDTLKSDYSIEDISCNCKDSHNLAIEFYDKINLKPKILNSFEIYYKVKLEHNNFDEKVNNNSKLILDNNNIDLGFRSIKEDNIDSDKLTIKISNSLFNDSLEFFDNVFFYHSCKLKLGSKNCKRIKLNVAKCEGFGYIHNEQLVFKYEHLKDAISYKNYKSQFYPGSYNFEKNVRMYEISRKKFFDE